MGCSGAERGPSVGFGCVRLGNVGLGYGMLGWVR
jgi:hypothetical protein